MLFVEDKFFVSAILKTHKIIFILDICYTDIK